MEKKYAVRKYTQDFFHSPMHYFNNALKKNISFNYYIQIVWTHIFAKFQKYIYLILPF